MVKKILSAIAVAIFGFVLLNLTFIFDFLFQSLLIRLIGLFVSVNLMGNLQWLPPVMHGLFVMVIAIISWFVFQSKLGTLYKAIYLTVPLAVVFATFGMFFYQWPVVAYGLGSLFGLGLLYCFYRTKQSWLYYYILILVGLAMLMIGLLGIEI